jgi:hypothetical protein
MTPLRAGAVAVSIAVLTPLGSPVAPAAAPEHRRPDRFSIEVLSSARDQVSGGDALVAVHVPRGVDPSDVRITVDRVDVSAAFAPQGDELVGLVEGIPEGRSTLTVASTARGRKPAPAHLSVTNHPISGPMFSGPQQQPFVCTTARGRHDGRKLLGQPLVDNQDHFGIPVAAETPAGDYPQDARGYPTAAAEIVGWSGNCSAVTRFGYVYRSSTDGQFHWLDDPDALPADVATTTTLDGDTVPFVVRWERGTINRFIYSIAVLAPAGEADPEQPDDALWNRRLVFSFDGGVGIGHFQGTTSSGSMLPAGLLGDGYGVMWSSGTRTSTHYNLQVGGETALMVKERFVEQHACRCTRWPSAVPVERSSSTCTPRTTPGSSTPRSRSTRTPTWSPRPSTSGTASCSSTTSTPPTVTTRSGRIRRSASRSSASTGRTSRRT